VTEQLQARLPAWLKARQTGVSGSLGGRGGISAVFFVIAFVVGEADFGGAAGGFAFVFVLLLAGVVISMPVERMWTGLGVSLQGRTSSLPLPGVNVGMSRT
jgi:hypothetical protein